MTTYGSPVFEESEEPDAGGPENGGRTIDAAAADGDRVGEPVAPAGAWWCGGIN